MSSSTSKLSSKLQTSTTGSYVSNFEKGNKDISELLKESPKLDPNTINPITNTCFPAILESILYVAQSELQLVNICSCQAFS